MKTTTFSPKDRIPVLAQTDGADASCQTSDQIVTSQTTEPGAPAPTDQVGDQQK